MRATLDARGRGVSLFASSLALMKASIGDRFHKGATCGGLGS